MSYLSYWANGRDASKSLGSVRDFCTGILCGIGDVAEMLRGKAENVLLTLGQKVWGERWDEKDASILLDIIIYSPVAVATTVMLLWLPGLLMP